MLFLYTNLLFLTVYFYVFRYDIIFIEVYHLRYKQNKGLIFMKTKKKDNKKKKNNPATIVILLLIFILVAAYTIFANFIDFPFSDQFSRALSILPFYNEDSAEEKTKEKPDPIHEIEEEEEDKEALLMAAGDVMVHTIQLNQAKDENNDYDFSPSYEYITDYLENADVAVANLETTFAGPERGYSCFPLFNTPDALAHNLKDAGFDLMCTANNHSLDMGKEGLFRTINVLRDAGLQSFGTYQSREERDTSLIVDVNGINVGFLAYTDSTNAIPIPEGKDYIVNYVGVDSEPSLESAAAIFEEDIERARNEGADLVAVYMHWGHEYQFTPHIWQEKLAESLAKAGADMILGSHPHVIQPMEFIEIEKNDGSSHEAFVAYSMGNFVSNQHYIPGAIPTEEVKYGLVLKLHLAKEAETEEAYIDKVEYMLTWVNRDREHQILPLHEAIASEPEVFKIPENKYNRLEPIWDRTLERLENFQPAFTP